MLETDTRVEVKKLVEATVSCLFLPFQSGQLVIFFLELMVIRLWPTWQSAAVREGGGLGVCPRDGWAGAVLGGGCARDGGGDSATRPAEREIETRRRTR